MSNTDKYPDLTQAERGEIADILKRRANEAVTFEMDLQRLMGGTMAAFPGSVRLAIDREAYRLRGLSDRVLHHGDLINPPDTEGSDEL